MRYFFLFAVLVFSVSVFSPHGYSTESVKARREADSYAMAEKLMQVFDLVIEKHVDPPTRQALVHRVCVLLESDTVGSVGIGKTISNVTRKQMCELISGRIDTIATSERETVVNRALKSTLENFAATELTTQSEHRVQEQLAANRYVGIGIAIGMSNDLPIMMKVFPGGPAATVGAKDRDIILEVDGVSTEGKKIQETVQMLRGREGTKVDVAIKQPDGEKRSYTMTRGVVPIKHVGELEVSTEGIATVSIASVTDSILNDLRALTPQIKRLGLRGLVVVIGQSKSSFRSAVTFANALIDGKTIGAVQDSNEIKLIEADAGELWPELELAFVVSVRSSNALTWALEGIHRCRGSVVVGMASDIGRAVRPLADGGSRSWKYLPCDVPESGWTCVIPTAKLLAINPLDSDAQYQPPNLRRTLTPQDIYSNVISSPEAMTQSLRKRGDSRRKSGLMTSPVQSAVKALQERIEKTSG